MNRTKITALIAISSVFVFLLIWNFTPQPAGAGGGCDPNPRCALHLH